MNADLLDSLARRFMDPTGRRTIVGHLARTALGGSLAAMLVEPGKGRAKKKCKSCRKRKKCKKQNNSPSGNWRLCQEESWIPACPPGDVLCESEAGNQCCLSDDTCDPVNACLTDSCSVDNDFCSQEWAHCQGTPECGCFVTVDVPSQAICANLLNFNGCPVTSGCESSDDCKDVEFCVSMPCCPEGKSVCIPLCVPPG